MSGHVDLDPGSIATKSIACYHFLSERLIVITENLEKFDAEKSSYQNERQSKTVLSISIINRFCSINWVNKFHNGYISNSKDRA